MSTWTGCEERARQCAPVASGGCGPPRWWRGRVASELGGGGATAGRPRAAEGAIAVVVGLRSRGLVVVDGRATEGGRGTEGCGGGCGDNEAAVAAGPQQRQPRCGGAMLGLPKVTAVVVVVERVGLVGWHGGGMGRWRRRGRERKGRWVTIACYLREYPTKWGTPINEPITRVLIHTIKYFSIKIKIERFVSHQN